MKWLFYTVIIVAFVALGYLIEAKRAENDATSQASYLETKNAVLQRECDSLHVVVSRLTADSEVYYFIVDSLENSLIHLILNQNENKVNFENQIIRITAADTDSLFRVFTDYIDNRSR